MKDTPLTVERLFELVCGTERQATPHRVPDFSVLYRAGVSPETQLSGKLRFLEEQNTGYEGALERWQFWVKAPDGRELSFWADLLPGIVISAEPE